VAKTLKLFRNGAVGFIDWLDGSRCMLQSAQQSDQMIQSN